MRRSAALRFGLVAAIAMASCWSGSSAPRNSPLENRRPGAHEDSVEAYWCSISDGEFAYPPMPCAVRTVDGKRVLAKLAGSQRIRGVITPRERGFSFDGELYCPWGDCTKHLRGVFEPVGQNGELRGTFDSDPMVVTLTPAPADSAWGGATYGGASYGGVGYGGGRRHP